MIEVASKVTGSGIDDKPWTYTITFIDPVGSLPLIESDNGIIRRIVQGESNIDGPFVLFYDGQYTGDILYSASSSAIKESLEMLSSGYEVNVKKTNLHVGYQWDVSFTRMIWNLPSLVAFKTIFEVQTVEILGGFPTPIGGFFFL